VCTDGCDRDRCQGLHIRPRFLAGLCADPECDDGHEVETAHNRRLLRTWNLEDVEPRDLIKFIKPDSVAPYLCEEYNLGARCNPDEWTQMHLCAGDVMGTCGGCDLNHDVMDPQCRKLLVRASAKLNRTKQEWRTFFLARCGFNIQDILRQKTELEEALRISLGEPGIPSTAIPPPPNPIHHGDTFPRETANPDAGDDDLATQLCEIQEKLRVLRDSIGFATTQGQLGICDSFIEEALKLLHGDRTLD
jgi:hypothetical protein